MAINKYNDLSAIFLNYNNNNNIDTIFENTSRNMLDVVKASSHDDEIRTSCSYYGLDDLGPASNEFSSLLDLVHQCSGPVIGRQVVDPSPASSVMPGGESCSEVVNSGPTTPNSISISSSSSEAPNEGLPKEYGEDQNQDGDDNNKSKQQLKAKKKKEKKKKEPRFAFMTKTDVDHLDDGYRWRKYGQKAVKNSPFPRSYYRCTTATCGVKKRVERSSEDPSIVVTTYEGQHSHPCPIMTRSGFGLGFEIGVGAGMGTATFPSQPLDQCTTAPIVFGGNNAAFSSTSHIFPYFHDNKYHQQQYPRNYTQFLNPNCSSSLRTLTFKDGGGCHGSSSSIICSLATTISSDGDGGNNFQPSNPIIDNLQLRHIQPPCPTSNSHHQLRDDGLLQDIVPSQMRNKAMKEE